MVSESKLTIRSTLVALLLSNLVIAEPLRYYGRDASDSAVTAPEIDSPSTSTQPDIGPPPAIGSSSSGGDDAASGSGAQTDSSSNPDASSAGSGAVLGEGDEAGAGAGPAAGSAGLLLCGSQQYSQEKV